MKKIGRSEGYRPLNVFWWGDFNIQNTNLYGINNCSLAFVEIRDRFQVTALRSSRPIGFYNERTRRLPEATPANHKMWVPAFIAVY